MPQWSGDYSRDMFPSSRRKQYVKARGQQNTEVADADYNDNTDLLHEKLRTFIEKLGGPNFFFEDAYKVVADGSDNDVEISPGSGFIYGHEAYLGLAARYANLGASQEELNLHSVSTLLTATVLTDTSMNWGVNELVGRELFPDVTDGTSFTIISNTATTITTAGDMTVVAEVGDSYYIGMSTPSGGNRTDTVWLNLYLDEIDASEDPYLFHNLGSGIELDRRIKARTILMVEQGGASYVDYPDVDGNDHYLVKLATIQRLDGIAAINLVDVLDERNLTTSAGGSVVVTGADSTGGTLNEKITTTTPITTSVANPGGDESLNIGMSSPGDPSLFLRGTSPPSWAAPPSGGGGGGGGTATPLEGKTQVPVDPADRYLGTVYNSVGAIGSGASVAQNVNVATANGGRTIPTNATHAVVRFQLDVNIQAGDGNSTIYVEPLNGAPVPDSNNQIASVNGNVGAEVNLTEVGSLVVPLTLSTPTLTMLYKQNDGGAPYDTALRNVVAWVDAWYIEDTGSSPNPVSFGAALGAGGSQAIPAGAGEAAITQVVLDVERWDDGAGFDLGLSQFVAPRKGKYFFNARVTYQSVPSEVGLSAAFGKNVNIASGLQGDEIWYGSNTIYAPTTGGSDLGVEISAHIDLDEGDVVALYTQHTHGSPISIFSVGVGVDFEGSGVRWEGHLIASVGVTSLEGKTFIPVDDGSAAQTLLAAVSLNVAASTDLGSGSVDLSALATVPVRATHVLLSVGHSFDTSGATAGVAQVDIWVDHTDVTVGGNRNATNLRVAPEIGIDRVDSNSTPMAIEIGDLPNSFYWAAATKAGHTIDGGTLQLGFTLLGFYIDEVATVVLQGTNALEGKTFLPVHKRVLNLASQAATSPFKGSLDLASLSGVPVPSNATHAMLRFALRASDVASSDPLSLEAYLAQTSVDPGGTAPEIAEANVDNLVVAPRLLSHADPRTEFMSDPVIVPINTSIPNVYYWAGSPSAYAGGGLIEGDIWLEAYLLDDLGTSPSPFGGFHFISDIAHPTSLINQITTAITPPQTFTYNLADFSSPDPLFDISKVCGVLVRARVDSDSADMSAQITLPDGSFLILDQTDQIGSLDDRSSAQVTMIPINVGQASFQTRTSYSGGVAFGPDTAIVEVLGLQQYIAS